MTTRELTEEEIALKIVRLAPGESVRLPSGYRLSYGLRMSAKQYDHLLLLDKELVLGPPTAPPDHMLAEMLSEEEESECPPRPGQKCLFNGPNCYYCGRPSDEPFIEGEDDAQ